jgi:hypothetical protein
VLAQTRIAAAVCLLLLVAASETYADNGKNNSSGSVIPSSGDAVKAGDILFFRSDAPIFTEVFTQSKSDSGRSNAAPNPALTPATAATPSPAAGSAPAAPVAAPTPPKSSPAAESRLCAPAHSRFNVQSISPAASSSAVTAAAKDANAAKSDAGNPTPADTQLVVGVFPRKYWFHMLAKNNFRASDKAAAKGAAGSDTNCVGYDEVTYDVPYQFNASDLSKVATQRMGFTWGALVIPYKFYFTDKSIQGNPSTVAFAGYEGWFPGVSLALVGSAGLGVSTGSSNSTTTSTTNGTTGTGSSAAIYTVAAGFIATFGGSIKAGVMFGRDYESNAAGFKYENKTWMALSVGTSF